MMDSMLTVSYGSKMRLSTHTTCFTDLYLPQLSNRGYLGITSRNSDRHSKDLDVAQIKVMNMNPNFYKETETPPESSAFKKFGEKITSKMTSEDDSDDEDDQMYTDEMEG